MQNLRAILVHNAYRKSLGIFHNSCTTARQTDNSRDIPLGMELLAASDNITNAISFVQPWGETWKSTVSTKPHEQLIPAAQLLHRIMERRGPAEPSSPAQPRKQPHGKRAHRNKAQLFPELHQLLPGKSEGHLKSISHHCWFWSYRTRCEESKRNL